MLRAALKTTALRPMALVKLLGGTASEIRAAGARLQKGLDHRHQDRRDIDMPRLDLTG